MRAIADNLQVLIARHDRNWRVRFINGEGASWYGMTPSQVVGQTLQDMMSSETRDALRPVIERVLSGESASYAGAIDYPDGYTRRVMINYVPDIAADGSVQGWFSLVQDVTEREEAVRALRESEEERRIVTDNLPVLMASIDQDWRCRYINRQGANWFGMDPKEVVGRSLAELFSEDTVARIRQHTEAAQRGETAHFVSEVTYPDGKTRSTEITFVPDRTPGGEVQGWLVSAQDVTEQQKSAEALRSNERQLSTIADNLPVLIARLDAQGRFEFINRTGEEWYDRPSGEIVGKMVSEIFGSETSTKSESWLKRALTGEQARFEERIHYPDGTFRDVDIAYIPDVAPDGEIRRCIVLVQNVTERKAAESRLRESETRLKAVVDNLPAFITYVDRDLRYRFANRVAEEWYGRPASEIIGRKTSEIHLPGSHEKLRPRIEAVLAGQDQRFEATLLYPDNVTRTVDQRWIADQDENGHVRGWFSLIQDISERKRLEADLLRQERLAAMGQLTGTVAHELRNPLGAVAASIAAVRRLSAEAGLDLERSLARAERGIARSDRIITELLDFARAKGLQREPTRFDEWLSAVLVELDVPEGVSVSMNLCVGDVAVSTDREDFRRAIINIVDNACQAVLGKHGAGGPENARVEVTTLLSGDRLVCEIRDNGPGIPAEILDRVMEPLFSTKSFGTGLGLPTVQRIVEEHGGGIEIESELGGGALVRLWLPLDGELAGESGGQPEDTDR